MSKYTVFYLVLGQLVAINVEMGEPLMETMKDLEKAGWEPYKPGGSIPFIPEKPKVKVPQVPAPTNRRAVCPVHGSENMRDDRKEPGHRYCHTKGGDGSWCGFKAKGAEVIRPSRYEDQDDLGFLND